MGIFLYVPRSLLDQVLVCLLAPGFIAMALYSHQGPYFCQIKSDFTLCMEHLGLQRFVPCATIPGNGKFWIVDWIKYGGQQQGRVPVSQVEKIKEKRFTREKL